MEKTPRQIRTLAALLLLTLLCMSQGCGKSNSFPSDNEGSSIYEITTPSEEMDYNSGNGNNDQSGDHQHIKESSEPVTQERIVVLDPGHASIRTTDQEPVGPGSSTMKNSSVIGTRGVSTGKYEYELVLDVCLQLRTELESRGYTVILTREDSSQALSNIQRANVANAANADVFLRIHADGSTSSDDMGASSICISRENPFVSEYYERSRILSECLLTSYCEETGMFNNGVHERDDMTGNNWSNMVSCLFELGYMTNPNDDVNLCDPAFQIKMILGIANGLDRYFKTSV